MNGACSKRAGDGPKEILMTKIGVGRPRHARGKGRQL